MKRFYLLVEGQTEETFVKELLAPHYARLGLYMWPIIINTSPGHRGGVTSYGKVRSQLIRLCRQHRNAMISTVMDLYAIPNDFPGKTALGYPTQGSGEQKATFIERCWAEDINEQNFLPYLMVHEYEALLFVQPQRFADWTDSHSVVDALMHVAAAHSTPEDINDHPQTAPSKRILQLMPNFDKTFHGPLIAADIGLNALRTACPHFDAWLRRIDSL